MSTVLAAVLSGAAACGVGQEGAVVTGLTVRDSGGVVVVESAAPRRDGSAFELVGPATAIGSIDGPPETTFGGIAGATRLSDGRIAVLDRQARELRVFGTDGSYRATWAGPGEGPGELRLPFRLMEAGGDTLAVADPLNRSMTLFAPDGTHAGTITHPLSFRRVADESAAQSCCIPVGLASDGSAVWRYPMVWSTDGTGLRPSFSTIVRIRSGGTTLDTVAVPRVGTAAPWDGPSGVTLVEFSPRISAAVHGDSVYVAAGDFLGFVVMGLDGGVGRVVRGLRARTPVNGEWLSAWRERQRERLTGSGMAEDRVRQALERPAADSLPAVIDVLVSTDGHVWLNEWVDVTTNLTGLTLTYQVFGPDGGWLGPVRPPPGVWLLEVGPENVLGLRRGELDEEYVELFALER